MLFARYHSRNHSFGQGRFDLLTHSLDQASIGHPIPTRNGGIGGFEATQSSGSRQREHR